MKRPSLEDLIAEAVQAERREFARRGGLARKAKLTAKRRQEIARMGGKAKWANRRKVS